MKSAIYFNVSGKKRIFCLMCASELLDDAASDDDEYVVFAVDLYPVFKFDWTRYFVNSIGFALEKIGLLESK